MIKTSESETAVRPRSEWVVALTVAGVVLMAVFTFLGFSRVNVTLPMGRETSCGTGFSSGWAEDMLTGTVCEGLMGDRHRLMTYVGLPGVVLLLLAGAGAARTASRRPRSPGPPTSRGA